MKTITEIEQFEILKEIYKEAEEKSKEDKNKKVDGFLELKTNSDTDTAIFLRKTFSKLYSFRMCENNPNLFYDRWNNFPNKRFTKEELLNTLITLMKNP